MNLIHLRPNPDTDARLTLYLRDPSEEFPQNELPMMLVLPGGAYVMTSDREAETVAMQFYARGYHAAVLRYTVAPAPLGFTPLKDAMLAVRCIRRAAAEYHVLPDKIAVCGFSAGAHLTASLGATLPRDPEVTAALGDVTDCLPNALVLSYPVISSGPFAHRFSFQQLTDSDRDDERTARFSVDKLVTPQTPPTFLWHTQDDELVPVENSLLMASALQAQGVPYELHVFRHGQHGLSLCTEQTTLVEPHCAHWVELCWEWLQATL